MPSAKEKLRILNDTIVSCRKCPRLVRYRESVARAKKRAFLNWDYWGKPVPGFGDARAELLIIGLAPAAHGGNRTGRAFTGDRSGDFLFDALHRCGFASQAKSRKPGDGLVLRNAYIGIAVRCAPPANKPLPSEFGNCRPYLETEINVLKPKAVLALGAVAWNVCFRILRDQGAVFARADYPFAHGVSYQLPGELPRIFASYHPSQQNTFTGRLTSAMFTQVLNDIQRHLTSVRGI